MRFVTDQREVSFEFPFLQSRIITNNSLITAFLVGLRQVSPIRDLLKLINF